MIRSIPRSGALLALLGASLLLASPAIAQAKQGGKWWTPRQGGQRQRVERTYRSDRGQGARGFTRQWRTWGGRRVYRDMIVIRSASRGPRYQAWRTYCPPDYVYSRRLIRVRPVRFYVSAAAILGGVSIRGSYHRYDDCLYGCNFCDARFSDYDGYRAHVATCPDRPHGYRVECRNWDDSGGSGFRDDRGWQADDGVYGDDRGYSDDDNWRDHDGYRDEYRDNRDNDRDDGYGDDDDDDGDR